MKREIAPPVTAPAKIIHLEPIRIEVVDSSGGTPKVEATDARSLFDAGNQALVGGKYEEALLHFDRLLADFPSSELAVLALYNAGLALEGLGRHDAAIDRYRGILTRAKTGRDSRDAHIRAVAVLAELERWPQARKLIGEFLGRGDLSASDQIEGWARQGFIQVEIGDYRDAEDALARALELANVEEAAGRPLESAYFVAMAHFYLGEIPRRQYAVMPIRLPESQMKKDLNHKAELVLLATERYDRAIKTGHLYWATAAGYQIAAMQAEFRDAIVLAPIPRYLSREAAVVYERRVHKEARQFLEKALRIHQQTVELANLYKTTTTWSDAAVLRAQEIATVLARESSGELIKPTGLGGYSSPVGHPPAGGYVPGRIDL